MSNSGCDQLLKHLSSIEQRVFDLVREVMEKDARITQLENALREAREIGRARQDEIAALRGEVNRFEMRHTR